MIDKKKQKEKQKKLNEKVISIRWNAQNMRYFTALDYIDKRNGNIIQKDFSFNKFVNNVFSSSIEKYVHDHVGDINLKKLTKRIKKLLLDALDEERKDIERRMKEIAAR